MQASIVSSNSLHKRKDWMSEHFELSLMQRSWPLAVIISLVAILLCCWIWALNQTLTRPLISPHRIRRCCRVVWSPLRWCPSPTTYGCMAEWTICSLSQSVPAGCRSPRALTVLTGCEESHSGDWPQSETLSLMLKLCLHHTRRNGEILHCEYVYCLIAWFLLGSELVCWSC